MLTTKDGSTVTQIFIDGLRFHMKRTVRPGARIAWLGGGGGHKQILGGHKNYYFEFENVDQKTKFFNPKFHKFRGKDKKKVCNSESARNFLKLWGEGLKKGSLL